jgi:vacuole morphology and inheritance protein 14
VKDIVSESAATYVSVLHTIDTVDEPVVDGDKESREESVDLPTAFSLADFIPLLKERIYVINPFTRTFLVGWITLLDSIPDLELVTYLPEFLGGLFRFLSDPNRDVHVATQGALERFLNEIKRISRIKKGIAESRNARSEGKRKRSGSMESEASIAPEATPEGDDGSATAADDKSISSDDDWVPGQDVAINHKDILEILTANLDAHLGKYTNIPQPSWLI